jgi:hypothetical protein
MVRRVVSRALVLAAAALPVMTVILDGGGGAKRWF